MIRSLPLLPALSVARGQRFSFWAFVAAVLWAGLAQAQGILIYTTPVPLPRVIPQSTPATQGYRIRQIDIQARVIDQAARIQVSQTFVNPGSGVIEAQFAFPVPADAAIDQLTLLVDGKEMPAKIWSAAEARARYEAIVRAAKDPALLEWIGHGLVQTNVFPIPAGAERTVTLSYAQVLRKDGAVTDFLFPLVGAKYTSQPIEKFSLNVAIESTLALKNVYSPTHPVNVERSDDRHAKVSLTRTNETPVSDFRLFFDVEKGQLGASVLSFRPRDNEDGYFLLLASPQVKAPEQQLPKTVVFVVDKSGSMTGDKISQAKNALKFVLNNLREGDLFNIVAYDSGVESFRPELERYTTETKQAALGYVEGLYAGGGTNIHDALQTALKQLQDKSRPSYLMFMTDGLPTIGEVQEPKISAATLAANAVGARLLVFGVGYDVNSRLLNRLAFDNHGAAEFVRPNEDIEVHVSRVYDKISAPVLTGVKLAFEFDEPKPADAPPTVNRLYPKELTDIFAGQQVVLVGRYRPSGPAKVVLSGQVGDKSQIFDFPANFVVAGSDAKYSFIEKLWAMRRVAEIIDQMDQHGRNDELITELVQLATKHGILTPYTSFLAEEDNHLYLERESLSKASKSLDALSEVAGRGGVERRRYNNAFGKNAQPAAQSAPADAYDSGIQGYSAIGGGGYPAGAADEAKEKAQAENVRQFGDQTLYRRGTLIVATNAVDFDYEKQKAEVTEVERYSDNYFTLIADNTPAENQLLSQQRVEEQLLVRLRGKVYLFK